MNILTILGVVLLFQTISCDRSTDRRFKTWLETLRGIKTPIDKLHLDSTYQDIKMWSEIQKYAEQIPVKLLEISTISSKKCNNSLGYNLQFDSSLNLASYEAKYMSFFGRLQYNLCLQEMETKRAYLAAKYMDKSKWVAWFDAMHNNHHETDQDVQVSAKKLASYLKSYVAKLESKHFLSRDEQIVKISQEIGSIIEAVCSYITGDILSLNGYDKVLLAYLNQNRLEFRADPVPEIWAKSMRICTDANEHTTLVEYVVNIFITNFDSINTEDTDMQGKPDLNLIKGVLFASNINLQSIKHVRIGDPINLLESLQSSADEHDKQRARKLLDLKNIRLDESGCNTSSLLQRRHLELTYGNYKYPALESYVKSMNSLQFHVCNLYLRMDAARLAIYLNPYQIAALEEFRHLFDQNNFDQRDITGFFLEPEIGYGFCMRDVISRHHNDITFEKKSATPLSSVVRVWSRRFMDEMCDDILNKLPLHKVDSIKNLISAGRTGIVQETTARLFDYAIICDYRFIADHKTYT